MTEPATILERGSDKAPDAYRTISEVAHELGLPQHVLRFWESRFGQIRPLKRGGGRRYYKPEDIALLKGIQHLLYNEGYTIKGVQKVLKVQGVRTVQNLSIEPASIRNLQVPQDNETVTDIGTTDQYEEPDLHIEAEELDFPASAEQPAPLTGSEPADQMPLFNGSAQAGETSAQSKQQMTEFAKRLRSLREDLHDIREQLKKTDEQ